MASPAPRLYAWRAATSGTGFVFLLGAMSILGPLGTDMNLPALPTMARALDAPASLVQLTISSFMLAYGAGQLLVGPFSDRYGRRPVLLVSFVVFALAGIGCALVSDANTLIVLRFVHGAGACVGIVSVRAIVRDVHSDRARAASLQAYVTALQSFSVIAAPLLGAGLLALLGWRSIFGFLFLTGVFLFALVLLVLPETSPRHARGALAGYGRVLRLRRTVTMSAFLMFAWGSYFSLLTALPFVLATHISVPGALFAEACSFMVGSFTAAWLVRRIDAERMMRAGVVLVVVTGLAAWAADWLWPSPEGFLATMLLFGLASGITVPNAFAAALADTGTDAGLASGLSGAVQTGGGAVGVALGVWLPWGMGASAGMVTGVGVLAAGASYWWGARKFKLSQQSAQPSSYPKADKSLAVSASSSSEEIG